MLDTIYATVTAVNTTNSLQIAVNSTGGHNRNQYAGSMVILVSNPPTFLARIFGTKLADAQKQWMGKNVICSVSGFRGNLPLCTVSLDTRRVQTPPIAAAAPAATGLQVSTPVIPQAQQQPSTTQTVQLNTGVQTQPQQNQQNQQNQQRVPYEYNGKDAVTGLPASGTTVATDDFSAFAQAQIDNPTVAITSVIRLGMGSVTYTRASFIAAGGVVTY